MRASFSLSDSDLVKASHFPSGEMRNCVIVSVLMMSSAVHGSILAGNFFSSSARRRATTVRQTGKSTSKRLRKKRMNLTLVMQKILAGSQFTLLDAGKRIVELTQNGNGVG